ncbi:AraC family transcriptional regulator [Lichenihabitans sp. PAMC28606]|uniref:helix-turn-helix domain-containing protein n=1 Tax=Lichenihabitans sp. PAMC28606 TaxID=2880932 RepID=UPI001D09FCB5|nr:AraC family transcriptional regulator [Lichenihabitans sp. PAMC28606]UDL94410.1 AraC family transcriptional regulator [Lichenihabitans sp. PAMC28606]
MRQPEAALSPPELGAFGDTLAAYYHQESSSTASASWTDKTTFAITRLQSDVGLPGTSQPIPDEAALHVSIAIQPVPLGSYELLVDGREIDVPFIPALRTSILDLRSQIACTLDCGFDYVHYHLPREGLDEIARDHRIKPVETYRFGICEDDLVIAQVTKTILPLATSPNWSSQLAIDQFSLLFGAHVLQTYGGLARLPEVVTRGLAPWQARRAAEVLRSRLDGGVRLNVLARECGMSVSHFARSFRATFGLSAHGWLVRRRIEVAQDLLLTSTHPLVEIALQSGFSDQAAFNRTFRHVVGVSPGKWRRDHGRG